MIPNGTSFSFSTNLQVMYSDLPRHLKMDTSQRLLGNRFAYAFLSTSDGFINNTILQALGKEDVAWYMERHSETDERWGLVDRNGNVLTPGDFECYEENGAPFPFGLAAVRYAQGDGLYGYLNEQVWAEGIEFNVDGTSQENFDRNVIGLGMGVDYSLVELSGKVNGGNGTPQAFKLIKLIEPASSNEIGG